MFCVYLIVEHITKNTSVTCCVVLQLWDVLSNGEVVSIVWAAKTEAAAAQALTDAAAAVWKQKFPHSRRDDCTVICLFLQERHQQHMPPNDISTT